MGSRVAVSLIGCAGLSLTICASPTSLAVSFAPLDNFLKEFSSSASVATCGPLKSLECRWFLEVTTGYGRWKVPNANWAKDCVKAMNLEVYAGGMVRMSDLKMFESWKWKMSDRSIDEGVC